MENKIKFKVASIIIIALMILQVFMPIFIYATDNIVATNYSITADGYIINIEPGDTVADVLENVSSTTGEQCFVYKGNVLADSTDTVYTGMTLRVGSYIYTLVVSGDVNGDGKVTSLDLSLVMSAVVKLSELKGAYFKAADLDRNGELTGDGKITASDESILMMQIVGLAVPDVNYREISDDIIINVSTTEPAKSVKVTVQWPADISGLTKQIGVNGVYTNNVDEMEVTENGTVIAQLVNSDFHVVKQARATISNIDNIPPATFKEGDITITHTIANYILMQGKTADASRYYFSKDNGTTWVPNAGLPRGEYVFTDIEPNSKIELRMKATDDLGNGTLSDTLTQRTFKPGIEILDEMFKDSGVEIDKTENKMTLPDRRMFKLTVTANGSYEIKEITSSVTSEQIATEEAQLNEAIKEFEKDEVKSIAEILEYIRESELADVDESAELIITNKTTYYRIVTNAEGKHTVAFKEVIEPNGLTSSGQVEELETIEQVEDLIVEMQKKGQVNILELLNTAIQRGILLEENVNKNTGKFQCTNGNVYEIIPAPENNGLMVNLVGSALTEESGDIAAKMLEKLEEGLKNQIIDWAIADGITTEELAVRTDGEYETTDGKYMKIEIDFETGKYSIKETAKPDGAKITYTLTPDFPDMTNKATLEVTATYEGGVAKIELLSGLGEVLKTENSGNLTYEITNNGNYIIRATTTDNKVTEKKILIGNISALLPIKVTITPESARNTIEYGEQNGIETGPITVTLKYSEALALENQDKYQYKIGEDEEWIPSMNGYGIATQEVKLSEIQENCAIYARYYDGTKGLKQVKIVVDNVDNVAPNAFDITPILTSHSITVQGETTDTAADSAGHPAREGMGQILRYEYSVNGGEWKENKILSDLVQDTNYTIRARAIDFAGNATEANNSGKTFRTKKVAAASEYAEISYSTTDLTNQAVTVTVKVDLKKHPDYDQSNSIQYQILPKGSAETALKDENWETGSEFDVINNCDIYVRIVDVKGQVNPDKGYLKGQVKNIDNLAPAEFVPVVTARTQTSITVMSADKAKLASGQREEVKDAPATAESLSSGIEGYTYYLIPTAGNIQKIENVKTATYTFEGLTAGKAYAIYVEAKDEAGNLRISDQISTATNAKAGEITETTTTVYGTMEEAGDDNPVVPGGFKALDTEKAKWGADQKLTAEANNGLVIEDEEGNQYVWVPVDEENVPYEKWLEEGINHTETQDGDSVSSERDQIDKYKGFYIGRYEVGNEGGKPVSKAGATVKTSIKFGNAREEALEMYFLSSNSVNADVITGTQWDTLMKWISNEKSEDYVKTDTTWGNYSGVKAEAGSNEAYAFKNIYDLSGNVREMTNEFKDNQVIVRGGAYDITQSAGYRDVIGRDFQTVNTGYRISLYVVDKSINGNTGMDPYQFNPGPNKTINGLDPSYNNPVLPTGFKCVETPEASWTGVTPNGWNQGLVIEDVNGNQFVWVPVDGKSVKYEKGKLVWQLGTDQNEKIVGDELPKTVTELGDVEKTQIETYGGFYVARYEAGNQEGNLASKAGLKTVNALEYATAKQYAEAMYNTPYVKSGLLTGTSWDAMTQWIENSYGTTYVTKNTETGNSYYNEFEFTGYYAIGPNLPEEVRGEYQYGTGVTKPAKTSYLVSTGSNEEFKTKNIYDLAGNVWEYTSEYYTFQDKNVYIARGSDYYRKENKTWGIKVREGITEIPGEKRNEGGFRVMLYLSENLGQVGIFEDYNRTMDGKDASYDNPIIPAGFAPVNDGANWGDGKNIAPEWNKGLVIEDEEGNQFVWVPVDGTFVTYKKWTTRGISYKDATGDALPDVLKGWNVYEGATDKDALKQDDKTQVMKYGGFYVARYEASQSEDGKAISVEGKDPWLGLTWGEAKERAEGMIVTDKTTTGLITGTQWDTLLRWIANEKTVEEVLTNSTKWGNYADSGLGRNASAKNIFEIAGGSWEWTAEELNDKRIFRGGVKTDSGSSSPAAFRKAYADDKIDVNTCFRTALYITGKVEGIAKVPVQEGEALKGTVFYGKVNKPELVPGLTPVKWTGETWAETTEDDTEWYNYIDNDATGGEEMHNLSKWANAMTPDGTLFVWIPRYAYKITYNNPKNVTKGGKIDIVFLKESTNQPTKNVTIYAQEDEENNITTANSYVVHPAFRGDANLGGWDRELPGIWVAKDERGSSYDRQGGTQFEEARKATLGMTEEQKAKVDTHMAKMTEWGAAAYLSTSTYGSGDSQSETTTGNEYGINGMAGGAVEYVTAYLSAILPARVSNIYEMRTASLKYKQVYDLDDTYRNTDIDVDQLKDFVANLQKAQYKYYGQAEDFDKALDGTILTGSYYGDAFNETRGWDGAGFADPYTYFTKWGWAHGYPSPLFARGKTNKATTGGKDTVYTTSTQCSNTNFAYSYRLILIPKDPTKPELELEDITTTEAVLTGKVIESKNGISKYEFYVDGALYQTVETEKNSATIRLEITEDNHKCYVRVYDKTGSYLDSEEIIVAKHIHTDECYQIVHGHYHNTNIPYQPQGGKMWFQCDICGDLQYCYPPGWGTVWERRSTFLYEKSIDV